MSALDKTDWLEKFVEGKESVLVHGLDAVSAVQEIKRLRAENLQLRGGASAPVALFMQDGLIARVAAEFSARGERGLSKYGISMDDAKLSRKEWLQHAKEEAMDQVLYLQKLIELEEAAPELLTLPVHNTGGEGVTERLEFEMHNRQQAWLAVKGQLFPFLRTVLQGGGCWVLTVTRRKRTQPQNRRYWGQGVLAQIAAQAVVKGKQFSADTWHEQFKRQFIGVDGLPDGSVIGKSSTGLTTAEFSEFCAQVEAYAANELGVTFYDLEGR